MHVRSDLLVLIKQCTLIYTSKQHVYTIFLGHVYHTLPSYIDIAYYLTVYTYTSLDTASATSTVEGQSTLATSCRACTTFTFSLQVIV